MLEPNLSWVATNQIFQRHPRLHHLLHRPSLRSLSSIFAYSIVAGLFRNPFVASRILRCAIALDPSFASSVFARIDKPNTFSYNRIIACFPNVYSLMLRSGVSPDAHTFPSLLRSSPPDTKFCKLVHAHVCVLGFGHDPFVQTVLLTAYFECGAVDYALEAFDRMPQRDVVSWTAAISGLAALGFHARAVQVFNSMRSGGTNASPNVATTVSVMSACAGLGSLELSRCLHSYVYKTGFESHSFIQNSLVDSYGKCGRVACARNVFDGIRNKDLHSWTALISGLASHGFGKEVVNAFTSMQRAGVVPDSTAFVAVLSGCSHAGLVEEGVEIFDSMTTVYGIIPELKHYGCMVDLYSRAGLLFDAYRLLSSMPTEPNLVILGALLSACRLHENLELAELVAKKIESVCDYSGGARVLLSNMYADKKRWHEVVCVREATRSGKPQGRSWIDVRGIVHEFAVEDRSHPLAYEMSLVLNGLRKLSEGFDSCSFS